MVRCMHRTNIFLEDRQVVALDAQARRQGTTRAHVIRALVDRGLAGLDRSAEHDLAAIRESFGVLTADDIALDRSADTPRQQHLDRIWQR